MLRCKVQHSGCFKQLLGRVCNDLMTLMACSVAFYPQEARMQLVLHTSKKR